MRIQFRFYQQEGAKRLGLEIIPVGVLSPSLLKRIKEVIEEVYFLESKINLSDKKVKIIELSQKIFQLKKEGVDLDQIIHRLDRMGCIQEAFYQGNFEEVKRLITNGIRDPEFKVDDILVYDQEMSEVLKQIKEESFEKEVSKREEEGEGPKNQSPSPQESESGVDFGDVVPQESESGVDFADLFPQESESGGDVSNLPLQESEEDLKERDDLSCLPNLTLLQFAVQFGTADFVKYLINEGKAQIDYRGVIQKTPFEILLENLSYVSEAPQKMTLLYTKSQPIYQELWKRGVIEKQSYISEPFYNPLEAIEFLLTKEKSPFTVDVQVDSMIKKIMAHKKFQQITEGLDLFLLKNWDLILRHELYFLLDHIFSKAQTVDLLLKVLSLEPSNTQQKKIISSYFSKAPMIKIEENDLKEALKRGSSKKCSDFFKWLLKSDDKKVLEVLLNEPSTKNYRSYFSQKIIDTQDFKLIDKITPEPRDYQKSSGGKTLLRMRIEQNLLSSYSKSQGFEIHTTPSEETILTCAIKMKNLKLTQQILDEIGLNECHEFFEIPFSNIKKIEGDDKKGLFNLREVLALEEDEFKGVLIRSLYKRGLIPFAKAFPYLDTWQSDEQRLKKITPQWSFFAQVHFEHMIENSTLVGGHLGDNLFFLSELLKKFQKEKIAQYYQNAALLSFEIEETKDLKKLAEKVAVSLASLKEGESFLIPGGWGGSTFSPGHALLYEIVKKEDNKYTFTLFNTGLGLELAHASKIEGEKELFECGLQIEGIKLEDICFPPFLERLFFLRKSKKQEDPHTRKPEDIYHRTLPSIILNGRGQVVSGKNLFITPQRSGSCALSVCLAHLQKELGTTQYKTFKRFLKEQTLDTFFSQVRTLEEKYFVEEALSNYARTVLKDKKEYGQALERIEKGQAITVQKKIKPLDLVSRVEVKSLPPFSPLEKLTLKEEVPPLFPLVEESLPFEEKVRLLNEWKVSSLKEDVLDFLFTVERAVLSCENLWELSQEFFEPLLNLTTKYIALLKEPTARNTLTFSCLQRACFELASLKEPRLKDFRPANGFLETMEKNGLYLLKDKKLDEKNQEMIAYLREEKPKLFGYLERVRNGVLIITEDLTVEERLLLEESKKIKIAEEAKGEAYRYREQNEGKDQFSLEFFEKACLIKTFNLEVLRDPFLSLKKLSCFSFGIDQFQKNLSYKGGVIQLTTSSHGKVLIEQAIQRQNDLKLIRNLSFQRPSQEPIVSTQSPKTEEDQEFSRLLRLFSSPDITFRLSFILNGMKSFMFESKRARKLFEAYAFCVNGKLADEIEKSPFLKEQLKTFLNEGFLFFTTGFKEFENAFYFIRLSCAFATYFQNEILIDKEAFLTELSKNTTDKRVLELILIHKAFLLEFKKGPLDEEDVYTLLGVDLLDHEYSFDLGEELLIDYKRVRSLKEKEVREFFKGSQNVSSLLSRLRLLFQKTKKEIVFQGEYPYFEGEGEYFAFNKSSYWTDLGHPILTDQLLYGNKSLFYGERIESAFKIGGYLTFEHKTLASIARNPHEDKNYYAKDQKFYKKINGVYCPTFNYLDHKTSDRRLYFLFSDQEICRSQISEETEIYTDPKTGKPIYQVDQKGLTNLQLNEVEEDFKTIETWARIVSQVIPLERTFLFKTCWIFPELLLSSQPLVLRREGEQFFHEELGQLQSSQEGGLLFKKGSIEKLIFPDALFLQSQTFYRENAKLNVSGAEEVFVFEKGVPLKEEERIFLITFFVAKGDFDKALDLYNGWILPKPLSKKASQRVLSLLKIRNWGFSGRPLEQEALLLKMASKIPFQFFEIDETLLPSYFEGKGNLSKKYHLTTDEIFSLLRSLESQNKLTPLLKFILDFYKTGRWDEKTLSLDLEREFFKSFDFEVKETRVNTSDRIHENLFKNINQKELEWLLKDEIRFLHNPVVVGASNQDLARLTRNLEFVESFQRPYMQYSPQRGLASPFDRECFFGPPPFKTREVSLEKPNPSRTQYVAKRFEWRGEVSFKEKVDSPEILKKILEEFINKEPEDFVKREEARLRRYGKIEEPLTLEDLIMAFLQLDAQTLGERTYLNEEELKTLQETIVAFLQASTPSEKNYTLNRQTIPLLVFEYVAKFSIREKNVKMIERLSSDEMLFEQLVMGGGKTKVLLPLLALFKADGNRLVVIVVPEPLLETNLEDLSSSSFHTFKQKAIHFHWNLETPRDQVYLEKRVEELEDLIKKRGYLITTPTDIHHLILTYTALLDEKRVGSAVQIEKLFTLFQEKGNAIIDEFHTVAAPRKEVRYATGEKKYLNPLDIASVRKMYEMMSEKKLVPFDPKTKTLKHHLISEEEFETVKREILKISNEPLFQKEVNTLLKSTLYNKKYGPSQEKEELLYCIPYSDEKTPKEGSEFENPFATLNYSFQYYMSKGIGEKAATVFLEDLKKTIREEMGKSGCSFLETKTGAQMLSEIEGFSFDMSVERFKEGVNQSIRALLFFVETQVAPKIGFFEEVSLSNAPRLFSFFSKIQALSATPYNFKTYPQDMKLQLDDHDLKLIENKVVKEKGDSLVITLRDKGIDAIFEKIPLKENQVRAFIDVGAFFENKKNREIALELLQYFKKECPEIGGVRYFEGDILRVEGDEGSQDLFTYYDRTHTTGVDIPQKEGAKAIVFIGQLTLKSDLIQAIGRMRGLLNKRQEIIPLMDEDEAVKVPSVSTVPTFNEVLTHSKSLEDKEGLEDITQSQIQYRENEEITKEVKKLHSLKSSEKIEAFKKIRETSFFVRKVKSFLSEEEGVSRVNMEVVTEQITEQKQSITQQVSLKMESAYAKASPIKEFGEVRAFSWESIKSFEDLNFKRVQEVLKEERGIEKSIFSDTLYFSPLIESPFLEVKASPFTQYGETPYHVLGLRDKNNKIHFVILSLNETAQLIQKPLKGSILFSGLTGNIVGTPQDRFKEEEKELVLEILSQTRFLSGHLHHALKPKDLASFKKWFESDGREERVKLLPFVLNQEGLKTYMSYLIDLKI